MRSQIGYLAGLLIGNSHLQGTSHQNLILGKGRLGQMSKNLLRILTIATMLFAGSIAAVEPAVAGISYQVSFNSNYGSGVMARATIPSTGKALPLAKFIRDDFKFLGWSITKNGPVKYKNRAVIKPKSKLTLYAQWQSKVTAPELFGHDIGNLLWSDSFSGTTGSKVSSANWTTRYCGHDASNGGGSCWGESQYYTPDAIRLDQGNAVITTNRITTKPDNVGECLATPCRFTSGRFDTQGKVSFKYGYIETRMKMPVGGTNWPAFWALGDSMTDVGWPLAGEIDIAEQGGDRPTRASSAVHFSNIDLADCCDNHRYVVGELVGVANYQTDFHTYGLAWKPDELEFFVDRELMFTAPRDNIGENYWAFNAPFFLIFDNATGPFGGSYTGWQSSQTLIDYVRVWQLDGKGTVIKH